MPHPYDGSSGLTPDERDDLVRTPLQFAADCLLVLLLVVGSIGGWAMLIRWAIWGW